MSDQIQTGAKEPGAEPPGHLLPVMMLAVFTVSVGFGILLPQLPALIERLLGNASSLARVSRATGLMTALYMFALFVCAPLWGRLSDHWGRRFVMLIGLAGFGVTMISFALFETLAAVYVGRVLSGVFAAAVAPVALATVTDFTASRVALGRRLSFVSLAGISGFLLGPTMGVILVRSSAGFAGDVGALEVPLVGTGVLALIAALAVAFTLRANGPATTDNRSMSTTTEPNLVRLLLALGFAVSAGVAVFEVGLALRGSQELGLSSMQIAAMFTLCSLVMIVVQAVVFSPWVKPEFTRWLIAPAFGVMAAGLFAVPMAGDFAAMLGVTGAVAASAGILSPILTYWVASHAGHNSGEELGRQTSAASLGAAVGSAAGGLLFNVSWLPNAAFLLMASVTLMAVWASLRLPGRLAASGAMTGQSPDMLR